MGGFSTSTLCRHQKRLLLHVRSVGLQVHGRMAYCLVSPFIVCGGFSGRGFTDQGIEANKKLVRLLGGLALFCAHPPHIDKMELWLRRLDPPKLLKT